jgi:hypothetical protein
VVDDLPETGQSAGLYGILAEFETPDELVAAARASRRQGYVRLDAFTPFPVEALQEVLAIDDRRLGPVAFLGGVAGLMLVLSVAWYIQIDYPINVGGRPLFALPAFLVIGFEMMILGIVVAAIGGMLVLNRLPRLHHPFFEGTRARFASDHRFFLCVFGDDPHFDADATRDFLKGLRPVSLEALRP